MFGLPWPELLAASLLTVLGTARVARVIAEDDFPPSNALRNLWIRITGGGPWSGLILCTFCLSMYLAAINITIAVLSDLHNAWWAINAWLSAAYLAGIVTARDLPADARE